MRFKTGNGHGIWHEDGSSYRAAIDSDESGIYHSSGAYRIEVYNDSTSYYTPSGAINVRSDGEGGYITAYMSKGIVYDEDAQTYFDRASAAGFDFNLYYKAQINDLFLGLKADGIYTKLHCLWDLGAPTAAVSLLNMVQDNYNLVVNGDPRFEHGRGWTTDGVDDYLETGYKYATGMQNDAHFGVMSRTAAQGANADFGNGNSALLIRDASDRAFYRINSTNGSAAITSITSGVGHWISSRTASAGSGNKLFRNGVTLSSSSAQASAAPDQTYTFSIGRRVMAAPTYANRHWGGMFHLGTGLTDAEAGYMYTRIRDYRAAIEQAPVIRDASPETRALLTYIRSLTGTQNYMIGTHDRFDTPGFAPDWTNAVEDFHTMTGKYPAYMQLEYANPRGTAAKYTNMVQRIKDLWAMGIVTMLHDHPGNPTNANLYDDMPNDGGGTGTSWDTTGNPGVTATLLTGGTHRQKWLDYLEDLRILLDEDLVVGGVKIPIILRWFHEINGNWFWWGTTETTSANTRTLLREFSDYFIDNGVTNALFCANWSSDYTSMGTRYAGDGYTDIVSLDHYDNTNNPSQGLLKSNMAAHVTEALNVSPVNTRPFILAEVGYELAADDQVDLWTTYNGEVMKTTRADTCMLGLWREPWGPAIGDANTADFSAMVNASHCLTADKTGDIFG